MGFTDNLKRSLGFEETESGNKKSTSDQPGITDILRDFGNDVKRGFSNFQNRPQNDNPQS